MKSKLYIFLTFILMFLLTGCGKEAEIEEFSIVEEIPEAYEWTESEEKYVNLRVETEGGEVLPELAISVCRVDERITKNAELPDEDVDLIEISSDTSSVQYLFEVYTGWWVIVVRADGYENSATYFEVNDEISIYSYTAVMVMEDEE